MLGLIKSLHIDFKKSIILSSHLLDDVDRVCDSILIIDRGRVLEHGRIDVLRAHLRNRYKLRLEGNVARFIERLEAEGVSAHEEGEPGAGERTLLAEVPAGFRTSRFFELLKDLEAANGAEAPVLRSLVPDEEKLSDLFQRVVMPRHRKSGEMAVAG